MMMKRAFVGVAMLAATLALAGPGEHAGPMHRGMMGGHGFERNLFPPELVLENRTTLGLTDDQVSAIAREISGTHDKVFPLQGSVRAAGEQLRALLDKPQADEGAVLAAASQLMDLEKQVKLAHMGMMVRVKNLLTADQQSKLKDLRPSGPMGPMGPPDGPPPPEAH